MAKRVVRSGTPLMTTRLIEGFLRQYCSFASSANLLDVLLGHDPRRARRGGGVEHQEVGPRRVQDEADAMGIDDVHGLHAVVQELGRRPSIALEAEPHVFRRKGVAVVEPATLAQLELA